jgi:RNA polymerase sigma-70 factor (ECF subfamily)
MSDNNDPRTSVTLLGKLCDPGNPENAEAWRRFLDRYQPLIYAQCLRLLCNDADAEDVTGEVLLKLAREMKNYRYDPGQRFRGWLHTVVQHAIIDWWRRRKRQPHTVSEAAFQAQMSSEQIAACDSEGIVEQVSPLLARDLALVHRAMALVRQRVKPHRFRAFEETALNDRPAADVARELKLKVGDVYVAKTQIARILRKQIATLEQEEPRVAEGRP